MAYEGEYFADRDFYDWGLYYEIQRLSEDYDKNLDTLKMYRKSYKKILDAKRAELNDLSNDEQRIVNIFIANANAREINKIYEDGRDDLEVIRDYPWYKEVVVLESKLGEKAQHDLYMIISMFIIEEVELHNTMCFINMYTIIDEYLSEVSRAIAIYYERFIENVRIRTSYSELQAINNDTDLRDFFIKSALIEDKNYTGATNKLTKIIRFFDAKQEKLRAQLALYQIERNSIVHNKGIYKSGDLRKIQDDLKAKFQIVEGARVRISNERLDSYVSLADELSNGLTIMCGEFYNRDSSASISEVDV